MPEISIIMAENFAVWNPRFLELERLTLRSEGDAHLRCARIFRQEGYEDLAALHAWLAWRTGGGVHAAWTYSCAVLRGFAGAEGISIKLAKAWLKEPAHQLLIAQGLPDRMQF